MISLLKTFMQEDSGQDMIEYAIVASLIGLGAVASMNSLKTAVSNAFIKIGTTLTTSV